MESGSPTDICIATFLVALFATDKMGNNPHVCQQVNGQRKGGVYTHIHTQQNVIQP